MGYGAFITVINNSKSLVQVNTGGTNCMYGTGGWENLIPSGGKSARQYIEAKASGIPCCCEHSSVNYGLSVLDPQTGSFTADGGFNLYESGNNWSSTFASPNVSVTCSQGDQATITVTVNS